MLTQVRNAIGSGLALVGLFASGLALAQETWTVNPGLHDGFTLEVGAYAPEVKTTARLDSATLGTGTSISFEDDLGLDDRKIQATVLGKLRLGERWRVEGEYFALNRSGTRAISRTINFGGNIYPIGIVVNSEFDSDIYRLSAGYSFVKSTQAELGVALGLHVTDFTMSLEGANVSKRTGDALAPLPTIGIYGSYALAPRWLLSGRADFFSFSYNDYDGSLVNFVAGVDYRFTRNFGVGLGYRYVDYDLDVTKSSFSGNVQYEFSGPVLYLVGSF
ncbi:MAG: outer membrane beta-barrel protein [Burkholderiaceae bacterium]